jgi:hypothetical protein
MSAKYPDITVKLVGTDGNAFSIIAACVKAARKAKLPLDEINAFQDEAMASDYNALLRTCMKWFNIE